MAITLKAVNAAGDSMSGPLTMNSNAIIGMNGSYMLRDFNNGDVTLSASKTTSGTAGALYLGYNSGTTYTTSLIRVESPTYWKGTTQLLIDASGYLYDGGQRVYSPLNKPPTLQTARTINGTSFDGSANITTTNWGTARTLTIGNTGKSVNGSANVSWTATEMLAGQSITGTLTATSFVGALTGNATTATTLQTSRTITINGTSKSFNGSGNISWSLSEMGCVSTSGWDNVLGKIPYITTGGVVDIGKYIDFHVAGSTGDYTTRMYCADTQGYAIASTNGFYQSSDARMKDKIKYVGGGWLDRVCAINTATYEYKNAPNFTRYGFIAQDVLEHLPECTSVCDEGMMGIDSTAIIASLVESIKELNNKIEAQSKIIDDLMERV